MAPPTGPLNLDVEAISGICGSISIACWVVVFSPQIIENFRRGSADGLSLQFIIVWLAGDVFNILGAVLQGVLPTMIILAFYYTIADIVLLGQCFYYRGFTWRDEVVPPPTPKKTKKIAAASGQAGTGSSTVTERTALLGNNGSSNGGADDTGKSYSTAEHHNNPHQNALHERRGSNWSAFSPAVPFVPELAHQHDHQHHSALASSEAAAAPAALAASPKTTSATKARLQAAAFNLVAMLMVCAAGVAGWYLSSGRSHKGSSPPDDDLTPPTAGDDIVLDFWGQVFGYLCAILYLGSRLPQLLLNWRRQSTDGVSMLFFLFACLGNLTYVLSIFAYDGCQGVAGAGGCTPAMARHRYGQYLLVNLSWLAGSLGTLLLDMGIFVQFFLYRLIDDDEEGFYGEDDEDDDEHTQVAAGDAAAAGADDDEESGEEGHMNRWDQRPILQRNLSTRD